MAILEKEVWVKITNRNITHFKNKGYEIPINKKILVAVEDLPKKTNKVKLTKICDIEGCGKIIINQPYSAIIENRERTDGKDRCKGCGLLYAQKERKENIPYEKSLDYFAKTNDKLYLLEEFSSRNNKKPNKVFKSSIDIYWWDCPDCKSEYDVSADMRTSKNHNCPYCAGRRVNHTNCLWTTHPHIAETMLIPERGYEITYGSSEKEDFKCNDCGYIMHSTINNATNKGISCPLCSDNLPFTEKMMLCVLFQTAVPFETQKKFEWSKGKKYDFYIPSLNMIIETHGRQHYEESGRGRALAEEQKNDKLKNELAIENNISKYIIINCSLSSHEYIKNNIINSGLSEFVNINDVDWEIVKKESVKSFVKTVCKMWEFKKMSIHDIADKLKISEKTVRVYLKQGVELGWCKYDPVKIRRENGKRAAIKSNKAVVQISLDGEFIREWKSMSSIGFVTLSGVSSVCRGKTKTTGGFKWMYKSDYDKLLERNSI